jgi:histone H4
MVTAAAPFGKGLLVTAQRHKRKVVRDNVQGITRGDIRRLARRGGVKRLSSSVYDETRGVLMIYLESIIKDLVIISEFDRRVTISAMDVVYALKRRGRTIYGYGG